MQLKKAIISALCCCVFSVFSLANSTTSLDSLFKIKDNISLDSFKVEFDGYCKTAKLDSSFLEDLLSISQDIEFNYGVSKYYFYKYKTLSSDNSILKEEYLHKSLNYVDLSKDQMFASKLYLKLGGLYRRKGMYSYAEKYWFKAYEIGEENNYYSVQISCLNNFGQISSIQKKMKEGDSIVYEGHKLYLKYKDELTNEFTISYLPSYYQHMGVSAMEKGEFARALDLMLKSLEFLNQMKDTVNRAYGYVMIGDVYSKQNDFEIAKGYYQKGYDIRAKYGSEMELVGSMYDMAYVNVKLKKYNEAINICEKGIELAEKYGNILELSLFYESLVECYQGIEDCDNGFKAMVKYDSIHSIYEKEIFSQELSNSKFEYEIKKKEKQIVIDNQKIQLFENEKRSKTNYIYMFFFIIISMVILIVFIIKNNKKERILIKTNQDKIEKELEIRNKELTTHTLQTIEKNELLLSFKEKLREVSGKVDGVVSKDLQSMTRLINTSLSIDKRWDDFVLYFEKVHQDFFKNMRTKYPDLTEKDLQLCALIKLNMNTKNIAALLGVESLSVNSARHRLRKKMNLNGSDNLESFIQKNN